MASWVSFSWEKKEEDPPKIKKRQLKKTEQEANLKVYHNLVDSNKRIDFGFEDMGDSELRKLAETIGADTSAEGKKLAKASVALNVTALIYGKPEKTDVPSNQN